MKCYVITIIDLDQSVRVASRCIKSGKNFLSSPIVMHPAITPKDDPEKIFKEKDITDAFFNEESSRRLNCMAAFLSHHSLWEMCANDTEEYIIFEHDAVIVNEIPEFMNYNGCISLGEPSYGKYNIPQIIGVNPLTSKPYFPGAHAYRLKPSAAKLLIETAKTQAAPTDLFFDIRRFDWLQEYYPWSVVARDSFTTIQLESGCYSKHSYRSGLPYEIVNHA